MKQYLLPKEGNFYKANLHCHTTISDGRLTPEEVKQRYLSQGYSIVAYTDHCVLLSHHDLRDENFLPLTGIEIEIVEPGGEPVSRRKHNHICYIALEEENDIHPFYNPKSLWGNAVAYRDMVKFDPAREGYKRVYTTACINEMISIAKEAGYFVTYNHPTWSQERYSDYMTYDGMHAMEVRNWGCVRTGYGEFDANVYQDMLLGGKRLYAIATDDNHVFEDTCRAWTMIKADALEYRTITKALEDGNFYASWGPEIHELWFEDGTVHIRCSNVEHIVCRCGGYRPYIKSKGSNEQLTEAEFTIKPEDSFFRITLIDADGNCAETNAYFTDNLF